MKCYRLTRLIPSPLREGIFNHYTKQPWINYTLIPLLFLLLSMEEKTFAHPQGKEKQFLTDYNSMEVGVARIDITPEESIRLAGYGGRKTESEGVAQQLQAKALAFGKDEESPSILITVDLIGIPGHITTRVAESLSRKIGIHPAHLTICASHTHTGPEVGNLLNHFNEPLPTGELIHIAQYLEELAPKLEQVAMQALQARRPSIVSWGQGKVGFAINRRLLENGQWVGFGTVPEGPVDHSMPMLKVTDMEGKIQAILVNYACHGTTLGGEFNKVHGDWMGEAQRLIEANHPGATAMVSIGCGADANPEPREKMEFTTRHGQAIADEVERLLATSLLPLNAPPTGQIKKINLPYAHIPNVEELALQTEAPGAKGYYARLALDRLSRGEKIPESLPYPVQTWTFGNDLAMIFLAGEVVVDYALRLKKELDAERLWVNAYANDVPCYIASRRVIQEGGYEVDRSMYSYDRPSRFSEEIEDIIVTAVHDLLSTSFLSPDDIKK